MRRVWTASAFSHSVAKAEGNAQQVRLLWSARGAGFCSQISVVARAGKKSESLFLRRTNKSGSKSMRISSAETAETAKSAKAYMNTCRACLHFLVLHMDVRRAEEFVKRARRADESSYNLMLYDKESLGERESTQLRDEMDEFQEVVVGKLGHFQQDKYIEMARAELTELAEARDWMIPQGRGEFEEFFNAIDEEDWGDGIEEWGDSWE